MAERDTGQGYQVESCGNSCWARRNASRRQRFHRARTTELPAFARDNQPDPRMAEVILAGVENKNAVSLRAASREDAIELGLLQQPSRSVKGKFVHLADRFVAVGPFPHRIDPGLSRRARLIAGGRSAVAHATQNRRAIGRH